MKLIVIILVFLGGVGFCGYKTYKYFDDKKVAGQKAFQEGLQRQKEQEEKAKQEEALKPHPVPVGGAQSVDFTHMAMKGAQGVEQTTIGNYVFKNRVVPESPNFLRTDNSRLLVEKDVESNSWVWMGSTVLAAQVSDLAKAYDRRQMEMDLEFCLVLMNTDKIRGAGLSVLYTPGASWLSALQLTPDAGSLRLSLDDWSVNLDYQKTDAAATIVQVPVIRVLDGQP